MSKETARKLKNMRAWAWQATSGIFKQGKERRADWLKLWPKSCGSRLNAKKMSAPRWSGRGMEFHRDMF